MLDEYLSRVQRELPGLLAGFYVYGSVAYGAWDEHSSDVDCLALVTRHCTTDDVSLLREIHRQLTAAWPRQGLDVSYVRWADRGLRGSAAPPHPFHHDGMLHEDDDLDPNSPLRSAIGWWQVGNHGVTLLGPEASALDLQVTEADLLDDSRRLVEAHWRGWTRSPRLIASLRHAKSVDWAVLGILRAWYTIREKDVATKPVAAEYGLARLPTRWHRLIRETIEARSKPDHRGVMFRLRTAIDAALFMRFMVGECRRLLAGSGEPGLALYSRSHRP